MQKRRISLAAVVAAAAMASPSFADLVVNAGDLGTITSSGSVTLSGTTLGKPNNAQTYTTVNNASGTAWDRGEDVYQFTLTKPAFLYMTNTLEPEPPATGFGTPDHDYFLLQSLTTANANNTAAYFANANPPKQEATNLAFVQNSVGDTTPGSAANSGIFRSAGPTATNPTNPINPRGEFAAGTYYLSVDTKGAANAFAREGAYQANFHVRYLDEVTKPNARPARIVANADVNEPTNFITGSFGPGQVRWFEFDYTGQAFTVDTRNTVIDPSAAEPVNVDTTIVLYDSTGAFVTLNDDVGQNTTDPNSAGLPFGWSRINVGAGSIPNGRYFLGFVEYKAESNQGFELRKFTTGGVTTDYVINGLGGYLPGDTDLDDDVDFGDLLTLSQNYGATEGRTYATGDTNVDGAVNFDDLLALSQNYGTGVMPTLRDGFSAQFIADWALAQSLVPEPGTLAMLGFGATALLGRRRK